MIYPSVIVESGTSIIKKQEKKLLKAHLGSCIGVAIWDEINKIGGIIHILLSKPYSNLKDVPEKYASTGLPKFIGDIINSGGEIKYLKAAVAGGGFPEAPDAMDISINIGGKTAEETAAILKQYKIPVVKWETGGFFSCSLTLDIENFQVSINPFLETDSFTNDKPCEKNFFTGKYSLNTKIAKIKPIPQTVLKIIEMINSKNNEINDLSSEIKKDQVLSAMAIKLANSAALGRRYRVNTIDEAVLHLGEENIIKHILSYYLKKIFSCSEKSYSMCKGGLFHHALSTAILSSKLSEFTGIETPSKLYSAGLLHDLGKILLDQSLARFRNLFYRNLIAGNSDILKIEKNILGMNHCEAGCLIADKWKLPEAVKETIKYHHMPDQAKKHKEVVLLVHIADMISSWFMTGILPETSRANSIKEALDRLSLSPDKIYRFIDWLSIREMGPLFSVGFVGI